MRSVFKLAIPLILPLVASAAKAQVPAPDPRGLYVYSWENAVSHSPNTSKNGSCSVSTINCVSGLDQSFSVPGVDGVTLVSNWSAIEPEQGRYQWDAANAAPWSAGV